MRRTVGVVEAGRGRVLGDEVVMSVLSGGGLGLAARSCGCGHVISRVAGEDGPSC